MDNKTMRPNAYENGEEELSLSAGYQEGGEHTAAPEEQGEMLRENEAQKNRSGQNMMLRSKSFEKEIPALLELNPELRERISRGEEIPREVLEICAKTGVSLRTAYAEYAVKQARVEIERLRKENRILRQNAAAAAKAPVRGASAGGSDNKGKDPFLEGLLSDD